MSSPKKVFEFPQGWPAKRVMSGRRPQPTTKDERLPARSGSLSLCRAGKNSQNFVFFHYQEIFAIELDFGSGILAEQDPVAIFHCQREHLAFIVRAALADGDN